MATIPQTQIALNKQIRNNQLLALALLLVLAAGVFYAIYSHNQLQDAFDELKKKDGIIGDQGRTIDDQTKQLVSKDSLEAAKKKQDESIKLLGALLNDADSRSYTENEILNNLGQLAEERKAEIAKRNEGKTKAIAQLFSNSEAQRKNARRIILREYGDDKKLVNEMLSFAIADENFKNTNALYQVTYIMTQLSNTSLVKEKKLVEQFMKKMMDNGKAGSATQKDFVTIRRKYND